MRAAAGWAPHLESRQSLHDLDAPVARLSASVAERVALEQQVAHVRAGGEALHLGPGADLVVGHEEHLEVRQLLHPREGPDLVVRDP